ncbi:hypothetical protein NLI96_g539 [Meripilus lineatus]|uniref:Uncharacterized protein n=1 Tax=Meripilus lineatus TaxID=2056292 RepID=A0AAD5YLX2_9APHY|nr:hypothetical protein NLI96_g539 [Physisporinus lineatus]
MTSNDEHVDDDEPATEELDEEVCGIGLTCPSGQRLSSARAQTPKKAAIKASPDLAGDLSALSIENPQDPRPQHSSSTRKPL